MTTAGYQELLLQLPLISHNPDEQQELFIYKEDERTLGIVWRILRGVGHRKEEKDRRHFHVDSHSYISYWILAASPRREWNVRLVYSRYNAAIDYPLVSKKDALRLQSLFTGFDAKISYEEASFTVVYYPSRVAKLLRASRCFGEGAVQLWWPSSRTSNSRTPLTPSPTASGSIVTRTAIRGIRDDIASVVQDANGEQTIIGELPSPPLLVAIIHRPREYYAIVRINLMSLKPTLEQDRTIEFSLKKENHQTQILMSSKIQDWNLCSIATQSPNDTKEDLIQACIGERVSITFRSSEAMASFKRSINVMQRTRLHQEDTLRHLRRKFENNELNDVDVVAETPYERIPDAPPRLRDISILSFPLFDIDETTAELSANTVLPMELDGHGMARDNR